MASAQSVLLLAVYILLISEFILAKRDYYEVLGVPRDASERQIKKAFHKLALKHHPDRSKEAGAEARFREIAEAYETLSDEKRRQEYDRFGPQPSPGDGGGRRDNFHHQQQHFNFNFDDIFKDFDPFGQQQQQQHQQQQHQHHHHQQHFQHFHTHNAHHAQQKRHFDSHFQAQREAMNRHRTFPGGMFDNMFEDLEKMFSFDGHRASSGGDFRSSRKQHCRTVTQRRGNMVTTFTDCS